MHSLLYWLVLRPLLETPLRLVACFILGAALVIAPEMLLERYVDADLPRAATAALSLALGGAYLFLRASWRRRRRLAGPPRLRSFGQWFAHARPSQGAVTPTVLVLDHDAGDLRDCQDRPTTHAPAWRQLAEPTGRPGRFAWSAPAGRSRRPGCLGSLASRACRPWRRLLARVRRP